MDIGSTRMEDFCRICSRSGEFLKFELSAVSQISSVRIDDMIVYCTQQEVSIGDSLPQQICDLCFTSLTSAFLFRKLTYQSESEFRQMIESSLTTHYHNPEDPLENSIDPQVVAPEESILPDVAIKEEVLQLEAPFVEATLPAFLVDSLLPVEHSNKRVVKSRKGRHKSSTASIYTCKDCGYMSQAWFNFKRHQRTKNHTEFSKTISKRPLHVVKQILQYIEPPAPNPSTRRRRKPRTLYTCEDCGYKNHIKFNFVRHQNTMNHTRTSTVREHMVGITEPQEAYSIGEVLGSTVAQRGPARRRRKLKVKTSDGPNSATRSPADQTIDSSLVKTTEVKTEPIDLEPMDVPIATENDETGS